MEGKPHALGSDARCSMLDARCSMLDARCSTMHRSRPAQRLPASKARTAGRRPRNVCQHRRQEPWTAKLSRLVSCGSCRTKRIPNWLGSLPISGQNPCFLDEITNAIFRGPSADHTGAWAMFLANIYIKFDLRYNYPINRHIIP